VQGRRRHRTVETGADGRLGTRRPAWYGHPRCRGRATCVHDLGHCGSLGGTPRSNTVPGCGGNSSEVRSSPAGRTRAGKKSLCCVTTRGHNVRAFNSLGRRPRSLAALFFRLGVAAPGGSVSAMSGLAPGGLPAIDLAQAFRILTVALVPGPGLIFAPASLAQADSRARTPPTGRTTACSRTLASAHGRCFLPRESSGRMFAHSPRALSRREPETYPPA
jgi:hypothetical protein